jgi:hypothetical protein
MGRDWKSRPAPRPTTITEIARRYHAAAVALAQTLGLSLQEVLAQHRESVTAIFIESGHCDLRLPASVQLPPLAAPVGLPAGAQGTNGSGPEAAAVGSARTPGAEPPPVGAQGTNGEAPPPTTIPPDAGLPCGGQAIDALKPAQLAMLIAKVARLVQDEGGPWVPLLHALQRERQARMARGKRRQVWVFPQRSATGTGDGA